MIRYKIKVLTHGFHVQIMFLNDANIVKNFSTQMDLYEKLWNKKLGRFVRQLKTTYATYHPVSQTYGFHISLFESFLKHLEQSYIPRGDVVIDHIPPHGGTTTSLVYSDKAVPYDDQIPIVNFIIAPAKIRILPLQMGVGKTFLSWYSLVKENVRTVILMGACHIDTWLKDAAWMFENPDEEILVVKGKDGMLKLIKSALEGTLNTSAILISIDTMRNYLTEYENTDKSTYGCIPLEFYNVIKVGLVITDEAHENLHFHFRHTIETNVDKRLFLSATIESNDLFTNKLYGMLFPGAHRYNDLKWKRYAVVVGLGYYLHEPDSAQYIGSFGRYSHVTYEQWIMKDKRREMNYYDLVFNVLVKGFVKNYVPGQTVLIFFSTKIMCARMADYINKALPQFTCSDYTGDHDTEVLHSHDIITTTPGSAGTGKDIKGLITVISTVAVNKKEKVIQMLGRLRDLSKTYPSHKAVFFYLVAKNIPKQIEYHTNKLEMLQTKVAEMQVFNLTDKV